MKKVLISLLFVIFLNIIFITPITVNAIDSGAKKIFNSSLNETAKETGHIGIKISNLGALGSVGLAISMVLSFLGVLFLFLIIYGSFIWMNSQGNDQEVKKAKTIIQDSIIGLLIVVMAYAITAFIGNNLANKML